MQGSLPSRLLGFARELLRARDFQELLDATQAEALAALGYAHAWLFVGDDENPDELRIVDFSGSNRDLVWELVPTLKVAGDPMLEEIVRGNRVVVVEDARLDPRTNKAIVAALGNRTIINVPLRLVDKPFGAMGVGTFGEEGCMAPTQAQLDHLVGMASQVSVAASRIRLVQERARVDNEKRDLERALFQMQRLESLGVLASGIAHDFNNLLTVIVGSASLARVKVGDGDAARDVDAVLAAGERAVALTRQLLAMGSKQPMELEALDVNEQLGRLLQLLRRVLPAHVEVSTRLGRGLLPVLADRSQLDQVFMNLCINARDAMPNGGQLAIATCEVDVDTATLTAYPWASAGRHVRVTVSDTGTGMTADVMGRMFEPLFTTKGRDGGTGLGLAVAFGIVNRHRGVVKCGSAPGKGTTFEVFLPAVTPDGAAAGA